MNVKSLLLLLCLATTVSAGPRIAVVDTGIGAHPELDKRVLAFRDATGTGSGDPHPRNHGTHVAGIAARMAPNADLLIAKVMDRNGRGRFEWVKKGIEWAVERDADVINLSFGGTPDAGVEAAIRAAVKRGILVIVAAGNDSGGPVAFPANLDCVFAVRAMDDAGYRAPFSNDGPEIRVSAPGVDVESCKAGGGYRKLSGTSMAAPWVAGVAARWVDAYPGEKETRPARFDRWLRLTAKRDMTPDLNAIGDVLLGGRGWDLRIRR